MLLILSAVKKDHKEFAILLIVTSRFCCKFFLFLKVEDHCIIQPTNGLLFGHGRACVSIYYSAITRQLVLTTLIIGRDGNILSARNENCWSVRFSSQDIKDRSGIFCDLIGLFGVHFIYGSSMPLSFTLSYNITLIPLPWVFLWHGNHSLMSRSLFCQDNEVVGSTNQ